MAKPLTDEQKKLLERVQQMKDQKQGDPQKSWTGGTSKAKKGGGAGGGAHIPQKKP